MNKINGFLSKGRILGFYFYQKLMLIINIFIQKMKKSKASEKLLILKYCVNTKKQEDIFIIVVIQNKEKKLINEVYS